MCKHCWDDDPGTKPHHKDFIRGWEDADGFDKEVNYSHRRRTKSKKEKKKYPGCPGNDGGAHVYIWTTEGQLTDFFFDYYGFFKTESRVCVGCWKRNGTRLTERYERRKSREWDKRYGGEYAVKRGEPLSNFDRRRGPSYRWWSWENEDVEYRKARRDYVERKGWTEYLMGYWW